MIIHKCLAPDRTLMPPARTWENKGGLSSLAEYW
jgi:hypothetical protein